MHPRKNQSEPLGGLAGGAREGVHSGTPIFVGADMSLGTVGVKEFRAELAGYIDSDEPVAVTRHGRTVGFFIPTRIDRAANLAAFRVATNRMNEILDLDDQMDTILEEYENNHRTRTS